MGVIKKTSTYYKIKAMTSKIRDIQGGQGASKNYSMAQILLEKAAEKKRLITVMTDTYDNLKDGSINDFKNLFEDAGLDWDVRYNKTNKDLKIGRSTIQFRYISDIKSNAGKSKRRDILYINEANKIGWTVASTYIGRTHEEVYIDYNPDFEFWAHTELPKLKDENGNDLVEKIIVTYRDNEMLPQGEIDFIESRKDNEEWYRVYGLGQTGTYSDRLIYSFKIVNEIPKGTKRIPSGMDFGQSPDPTCLVDAYLDGVDLYLDEIFEENNLMPEKIEGAQRFSIADRMDELALQYAKRELPIEHFTKDDDYYLKLKDEDSRNDTEQDKAIKTKVREFKNWVRIGDSSGKTELLDLIKHGYNMRGVKKGPGSVVLGIKRLRSYNLKVTSRSHNLIKGLQSWMWKMDHNDKVVPEPDGHEPHTLAASRYIVLSKPMWE